MTEMRPWSPILRAVLALLAGIAVAFGLLRGAAWTLPAARDFIAMLPGWALAVWMGLCSATLGRVLGLERWWSVFFVLLPPLFVMLLSIELGAGWYFVLFATLLLVYGSTFSTRVPLYLAGPKVRAALLAVLPAEQALPDGRRLRFIDLGSGFGGVVLSLAHARPDGDFLGVELAPLPAVLGWCRARLSGLPNATLRRQSLWDVDLGDADVVHAFLSPVPMPALWEKAQREMKPGSLLVSNSFVVPGVPADHVVEVGDARGSRLHVWEMRARLDRARPIPGLTTTERDGP